MRHGGFPVQSASAVFPDFVAVRQVLIDGLTAVSYLHTPHSALLALPDGASTAQPCSRGVRDAIHGLGKAGNRLYQRVFASSTCPETQGFV